MTDAQWNDMLPVPAITAQPSDTHVVAGEDVTFTAEATSAADYGTLQVRWQSRRGSGEWADVSGATGRTLTVSKAQAAQSGTEYRAIATNRAGVVTSAAAALTVVTAPAESDLTEAARSGVEVLSSDGTGTVIFAPGQQEAAITLRLTGEAAEKAGSGVWAYLESDPVLLTSTPATLRDGSTQLTLRRDAVTAGAHRVAVLDQSGELLGWAPVSIVLHESAQAPAQSGTDAAVSERASASTTSSASERGTLPRTGANGMLAVAGGALLLLGGVLTGVRTARRRRAQHR